MTTITPTTITGKYDQTILSETTDKQRVDTTPAPAEENKADRLQDDRVSISKASKDMQTAQSAVAATPDVRQEKVNELKQAVNDGRYEVDAGKVAEKMIGSIISLNLSSRAEMISASTSRGFA